MVQYLLKGIESSVQILLVRQDFLLHKPSYQIFVQYNSKSFDFEKNEILFFRKILLEKYVHLKVDLRVRQEFFRMMVFEINQFELYPYYF